MEFTLTPWMLMPLALGIFALFIVLNHKKVHEMNKRWDERMRLPKPLQATYHDPKGRRNFFGAVGMIVIAVFMLVGMGTGLIDT